MRAPRNNAGAAAVAEVPTPNVGETQPEVASKSPLAEITIPLSKGDYSSIFFPVRQAESQLRQILVREAEAAPDRDLVITLSRK